MIKYTQDDITRFWDNIIFPEDHVNDCWIWNKSFQGQGYGQFWLNSINYSISTHKFSYIIHYGQIPNNLYICHTCDNRKCVNPNHLFLGTHTDNMKDMIKKMRYTYGDESHLTKISENEMIAILENIKNNKYNSIDDIIVNYNISRHAIQKILHRKSRKHLVEQYTDIELIQMRKNISKNKG